MPAVIAVNKGKIVGFDDETSYDTKGYEKPEDYWKMKIWMVLRIDYLK